jgi:hypothetical protein
VIDVEDQAGLSVHDEDGIVRLIDKGLKKVEVFLESGRRLMGAGWQIIMLKAWGVFVRHGFTAPGATTGQCNYA